MHNGPAVHRFPHCSGLSVPYPSRWVVECMGRIVVRTGAADGCGTAHRGEPACPGREHGGAGCDRGGLAGTGPRPGDRHPIGVERTEGAEERGAGAGRGGRPRLRIAGSAGAAHRPDPGRPAVRGGGRPGGPDRTGGAAGRGRDRAGGGGVRHGRGGAVLAVHRRDRRGRRVERPSGRDAAPAHGAGPRAGAGVGATAGGAGAGAGVAAGEGAGEPYRPGRQE